jgi:AraC-like DNA-binding protein
MFLRREPSAALRPFVKMLWALDQAGSPWSDVARKERVLPGGGTHIAVRLCDSPIRIFDDIGDPHGQTLGYAVIGGPRQTFYVRDRSRPISTVGAYIAPLAPRCIFGIPARELADCHTRLDDLWGPSVDTLRAQMIEAKSLELRLDLFEKALLAHLRIARHAHPAVTHALHRLPTARNVRDVVRETGYSQRRFIALFREELGLTPKVFSRLLRFQRILSQFIAHPASTWSDLAYDAGYSDQAHFNREFREFTGVTPGEYRVLSNQSLSHIPVLQ